MFILLFPRRGAKHLYETLQELGRHVLIGDNLVPRARVTLVQRNGKPLDTGNDDSGNEVRLEKATIFETAAVIALSFILYKGSC